MSSRTDPSTRHASGAARRAAAKARLAPVLSWLAAGVGLVFVLAFLIQAGLFAALVPAEKTTPVVIENPGQITAHESTVTGFDREKQPYEVTAVKGSQDKDRPELVHLETVTAKFLKTTGQTYDLTANTALYNTKIRELDLDGAVTIREGKRFTARMAKAHVVVEDKVLTSDTSVNVEFAGGTIVANGMHITNDGRNILFLNGVKARFGKEAAKGDGAP